jgi:hypothetical protein
MVPTAAVSLPVTCCTSTAEDTREKELEGIPVVRPRVAGMGVGSKSHWVCAPTIDGSGREVREFGATMHSPHAPPRHSPSRDIVVRAQRQPGHEVPRRLPSRHVSPHFAEQGEDHRHQPRNLCQVHAEQFVIPRSQIETVFGFAFFFLRPRCFFFRSGGSGFSFGSTRGWNAPNHFSISSSQALICS